MWLIYFLLLFSSLSLAQPAATPALQSQRQGILEFEFDPDESVFIARVSDANGTKPLAADSLELDVIDIDGKTVRVQAQRIEKSVFKATLNLTEGEHNLIARVKAGELILDGQYTLGVGKSVTEGRFGLVPPNPEVGRLSWMIGALIGVPLILGLLIGIFAVLNNLINPKRAKPVA
jgi:hypothetical protein